MLTHFQQHDVVEQDIVVAPKNKLKILFYHAGGHAGWLYPAALQLKTYIDLFYPNVAEHLEWLIPIQHKISNEELIKHIVKTNADVLCTSHYLWNHVFLTSQIKEIKSQLKSTFKIIAGGPSIDVNNNKDFFEQYPNIDYAVYGAGEQAFADIVDHLVTENPLIAFNTSNCAWKNTKTGKSIVADYKFVKMIETSPFTHNVELFELMVADAKEKNCLLWLPYTLTRGCPYSCTFCDWNSGFGNKVSRRKNTYQQEIDLFQRLGVTNIYLSDANVGQYDEDVEMVEYFAQKNLQENAGFHIGGNFSKLKKDNNLKIFHTMANGKLINKTFNFSIQDTNAQVLSNIDRPDVGWDVHVSMANELREHHKELVVKAQLIYGLPGQTVASWQQTLQQVAQENILPIVFVNEPLPASPAMLDPEYQRKFQFEYVLSQRIIHNDGTCSWYHSRVPKKSSSFNQSDLVHMNLYSAFFTSLTAINLVCIENDVDPIPISLSVVENFLQCRNYQNLYQNLLDNWTKHNNFFYTITFNGEFQEIADNGLVNNFVESTAFINHIVELLPVQQKKQIAKLAINSKFYNFLRQWGKDSD
jgi:putative methyltransferase